MVIRSKSAATNTRASHCILHLAITLAMCESRGGGTGASSGGDMCGKGARAGIGARPIDYLPGEMIGPFTD